MTERNNIFGGIVGLETPTILAIELNFFLKVELE